MGDMSAGSEYHIEAMIARQQEIVNEIERLTKESDELGVALRVIRRFKTSCDSAESKLGPPRPEGTPTVFEMAEAVIKASEERRGKGLLGREIVDEIGKEYWPGVKGPQILPSVYQFAKKGRLVKNTNKRFHTVKKDEAPTDKRESASKELGH